MKYKEKGKGVKEEGLKTSQRTEVCIQALLCDRLLLHKAKKAQRHRKLKDLLAWQRSVGRSVAMKLAQDGDSGKGAAAMAAMDKPLTFSQIMSSVWHHD